jgi:CBS domain-containing protein
VATKTAKTVRQAMHDGAECIGERQTLLEAAKQMERLDVGVLPICGEDDRLKGMITDRDIVVKALAHDRDPMSTRCGEFAQGKPVCVSVDAPIEEALSLMREHAIKRLPVLDEDRRLCGMITEGDLATHMPRKEAGELVGAIASAPAQHF